MTVLNVDLDGLTWKSEQRTDLSDYLGGIGLATKLFADRWRPGLVPLDPAQPVVLAIGPLSTVFPLVTKTAAVFHSPLTGEWGESYAGMRLAPALRFAGYDALIMTGRAPHPVYLVVTSDGVAFRDARGIWGLTTEETGRILREWETGRGHRSTLRIGPAGERGVAFAGVNVDTFRHFGRLGLGSVFGSKNLKALVVHGNRSYPIPDRKAYREVYDEVYARAVDTDLMEKYHDLGTAGNVLVLNGLGALPTRNLRQNRFERAARISGEAFAENTLIRKLACPGCPVGCIHIGLYRRQFGTGYEYESTTLAYDHELVYALGSLLGMTDTDSVYALIEKTELLGLDAITSGVLLAWATEAQEKGLITGDQLGVRLSFGEPEGHLHVLDRIVSQPSDFYRTMAGGLAAAAATYGGRDFALILGGYEMAGYHTGYGFLLGQAVGARHSHLCNAGYSLDQKTGPDLDRDALVDGLIAEEKWRQVLNSLCICLFGRGVWTVEMVQKALGCLGISSEEELLSGLGERIFNLKNRIKREMGFDYRRLEFPRRCLETPSLQGRLDEEVLYDLLKCYIAKAGV
ncbi:MAG: aldehyde:ferredoxin oxidoreductase [Candidatus Desulforudis sp.]|nr:aldehyde:ferredoxin oxidoreductase [Desulforudis sp.]